jgi:hypothetical protein
MRKRAMRGLLAAALFAAIVTTARAADDEDDAPAAPPAPSGVTAWWNGLFGAKPKPTEKVEKKQAEPSAKTSVSTAAEREALMRREKDDYFRRLQVCLRLREIAQLQNDEAFQERIGALEKDIDDLYLQRTASLGQGSVNDEPPSDTPKPSGARGSHRNRNMREDDQ